MRRLTGLAFLLILVAMPALAAKVTVDYDQKADLTKYHTFQYQQSKDHPTSDPLMEQRLVDSLQNMMIEGGMKQVDADPDVYVTFHINEQEEKSFTTMGTGYGVGMGWGRMGMGGMGMATTTEQDWTVGTIVVDIFDAKTNKALVRGTAQQDEKANPKKRTKQIDKAFDQMLARWQELRQTGK